MTKQRQTILTSATWGDHITELAFKYMRNPYKVQVGELDLTPAKSVTQEVIFISESAQKFGNLCKFIEGLTKKKRVAGSGWFSNVHIFNYLIGQPIGMIHLKTFLRQ